MALMMFSATALYTEATAIIYICITSVVLLFVYIKVIHKISLLKKIASSGYFLWLTVFYLFIMADGYLRTQFEKMNFDYLMFSWLSICMFGILLYDFDDPRRLLCGFCKACLLASVSVVIYIIAHEWHLIILGATRIGESLSGNVNTAGMHLGLYSLGVLFLYIKKQNKFLLVPYIIIIIFMLLTGSKKVFIPIFLGLVMYEVSGGIKLRKLLVLCGAFLVLGFLILNNSYMYQVIGVRILAFIREMGFGDNAILNDGSTIERKQLIVTALSLFATKPLLGWGYFATARFSDLHLYAHNNYVEILANYGITGFILYYSIYLKLSCEAFRLPKNNYHRYFILVLLFNLLLCDIATVSYTYGLMIYIPTILSSIYLQKNTESTSNQLIRGNKL